MMRVLVFVAIFISAAAGCQTNGTPPKADLSILFVGNSLTYYNDLPNKVRELAASSGLNWNTEMLAYPNYALEDHWNDGKLQTMIKNNHYTFVVVQQGPSSQADGREMLLDYGARIAQLCVENNSKLAFYMVWPAKANYYNFDGVIKNYTDAAQATNSLLIPVGKIWKEYFDSTQDFSYYDPADFFHPSPKGTEVAATIIFDKLKQTLK